jgi:hypothetical protein
MIKRILILIVLIMAFTLPFSQVGAKPTSPGEIKTLNEGSQITIDFNSSIQDDPAVAFSTKHNQFLVVYESSEGSGDIYGRFVDAGTGTPLGSSFVVAGASETEENPDVAYDAYNDRFVVVWQITDTTRTVEAVVVYGEYKSSGSQFPDTASVELTASSEDAFHPAIAYNSEDYVFMIVFEVESVGIKGRMAAVDPDSVGDLIFSADPSFTVRNIAAIDLKKPDIAWSSEQDIFFAVWEDVITGSIHRIVGTSLHDTYQSSGNQIVSETYYTVSNPPSDSYDCLNPSIAYDPIKDFFATVYEHKTSFAADAPREIRAGMTRGSDLYANERFFDVETTFDSLNLNHHSPKIAHAGVSDWLYVTYVTNGKDIWDNDYDYIMVRDLMDLGSISTKKSVARIVASSTPSQSLEEPAIGGSPIGRALIAWREEWVSTGLTGSPLDLSAGSVSDWDIFAQRIISPRVMIPILMKK